MQGGRILRAAREFRKLEGTVAGYDDERGKGASRSAPERDAVDTV